MVVFGDTKPPYFRIEKCNKYDLIDWFFGYFDLSVTTSKTVRGTRNMFDQIVYHERMHCMHDMDSFSSYTLYPSITTNQKDGVTLKKKNNNFILLWTFLYFSRYNRNPTWPLSCPYPRRSLHFFLKTV